MSEARHSALEFILRINGELIHSKHSFWTVYFVQVLDLVDVLIEDLGSDRIEGLRLTSKRSCRWASSRKVSPKSLAYSKKMSL